MTITVAKIAKLAEKSCFYVDPSGQWFRIQYCDRAKGYLQGMIEDSGEEYRIAFEDITLEGQECFYKLHKARVLSQAG